MNLINTPTRFLVNNNSALDHIYYNCNMITRSCVLDGNISDHEMIYVIHEKPKILPLHVNFQVACTEITTRMISLRESFREPKFA